MAWRNLANREVVKAQFTNPAAANYRGVKTRFAGVEHADRHILIAGRHGTLAYVYGLNLSECVSIDIERQTFSLHNPGYRWHEEIPQGALRVDTDIV